MTEMRKHCWLNLGYKGNGGKSDSTGFEHS